MRALRTGASGMAGQQATVDVIANNIANVNTTGFKRQRVNFQDLMYDVRIAPGTKASDQTVNPSGVQIGTGVRVASTPRVFTDGQLEATGKATDITIEGDGFFEISLPDGETGYTRAGDFNVDLNGNLVTGDGYYLQPQLTIPDNVEQLTVGPTGQVTALIGGATTSLGTITLTRFRNPAGLLAVGRNIFQQTEASGTPQQGTPSTTGFGALRQGALEKSNVEVVTELVRMIVAQRAYEMNSKTVKAADEMMRTANEIAR